LRLGSTFQEYIIRDQYIKKKFLLDSMDSFVLEATVAAGQVEVYVGFDSVSVYEKENQLWSAKSDKGIVSLKVQTTDKNFRMATWYYVLIKCISRRDALINLSIK